MVCIQYTLSELDFSVHTLRTLTIPLKCKTLKKNFIASRMIEEQNQHCDLQLRKGKKDRKKVPQNGDQELGI